MTTVKMISLLDSDIAMHLQFRNHLLLLVMKIAKTAKTYIE